MTHREFLIDVSRLIWRLWTGRLPTGIDRVCLAYLCHFNGRAQAVVQKGAYRRILTPAHSDRLIALLLRGGPHFRRDLLALAPAIALARDAGNTPGQIYLNIGHTGLHEPGLPGWTARRGLRAVYLIHDLIPVTHPQFCRAGDDARHTARMHNALRSAAGVICNSQATQDELAAFAAHHGLPMPPALTAWLAGSHTADDAVRTGNPTAFADRPYFVTLGTIEGRKNHILLLNIWQRLAARLGERTPRLLVIGQRGWEADHALAMLDRGPGLKPHVREMRRCDDDTLMRLLAGARALLMPSFAEGFGLPVIEALQLGTPAIVSDLPVFREIAGDIPTFLSPLDGTGWERAIIDFMQDSPERERQKHLMPGFRAPDWAGHFSRVEDWLATLVPQGSPALQPPPDRRAEGARPPAATAGRPAPQAGP